MKKIIAIIPAYNEETTIKSYFVTSEICKYNN